MFEDYVLGSEVASIGDFNISNISMLINDGVMVEGVDYYKYGGTTLLYKYSNTLPEYIKKIIENKELTDLSNFYPINFFMDDIMDKKITDKTLYEEVKINGKKFIKPKGELVDILKDIKKVKSVVHKKELEELYKDNLIKGDIKISKDYHLVWY